MREMNNILGFEIRNILNKNQTIQENHLQKISLLLGIKINLQEIYLPYGKNLGRDIFTKPIKRIRKIKNWQNSWGLC